MYNTFGPDFFISPSYIFRQFEPLLLWKIKIDKGGANPQNHLELAKGGLWMLALGNMILAKLLVYQQLLLEFIFLCKKYFQSVLVCTFSTKSLHANS